MVIFAWKKTTSSKMVSMRTTLILSCILVFSFPASSQNGILTGRITTPDGEAAGHISISLDGTSLSTLADETGTFVLKASPGSYRLAVQGVGLATRTIPVHIYLNDTTVAPDIAITATRQQLGEIVVQGQRHGYKTDKLSTSLRLMAPLKNIPQNIQGITV
jgi:iron complex outermembrane receptor protein